MGKLGLSLSTATFLLSAGSANAAPVPAKLVVLVEDLNDDAAACGMTKSALEGAIKAAMRYNRIEEAVPESEFPAVYVDTYALRFPSVSLCVASVKLQIFSYQPARIEGLSSRVFARVELCSQGEMLSTADGQIISRITSALKEDFDTCLSEIVPWPEP